jgi:hypothetical protein
MCRSESTRATTHHNSFHPNYTWRELVAIEVITPAVGEGSSQRSSIPLDDKNRLVVDTIFFANLSQTIISFDSVFEQCVAHVFWRL